MEQAELKARPAEIWAQEAFDHLCTVDVDQQVTAVRTLIEIMNSTRLKSFEEAAAIKEQREREFIDVQENLGLSEMGLIPSKIKG